MSYFFYPIVLLGFLQGLILSFTIDFWMEWADQRPLLLALSYGLLFLLLVGQLIGARKNNNGQLVVALL